MEDSVEEREMLRRSVLAELAMNGPDIDRARNGLSLPVTKLVRGVLSDFKEKGAGVAVVVGPVDVILDGGPGDPLGPEQSCAFVGLDGQFYANAIWQPSAPRIHTINPAHIRPQGLRALAGAVSTFGRQARLELEDQSGPSSSTESRDVVGNRV